MDEEFVEGGKPTHPTDSEKPPGWPRTERCNKPGKLLTGERCSSSFGESGPRTRDDEAWCREGVVLAKHQVRNKVARRPRREEGWRISTEFIEQVGESLSLDVVKAWTGHVCGE